MQRLSSASISLNIYSTTRWLTPRQSSRLLSSVESLRSDTSESGNSCLLPVEDPNIPIFRTIQSSKFLPMAVTGSYTKPLCNHLFSHGKTFVPSRPDAKTSLQGHFQPHKKLYSIVDTRPRSRWALNIDDHMTLRWSLEKSHCPFSHVLDFQMAVA